MHVKFSFLFLLPLLLILLFCLLASTCDTPTAYLVLHNRRLLCHTLVLTAEGRTWLMFQVFLLLPCCWVSHTLLSPRTVLKTDNSQFIRTRSNESSEIVWLYCSSCCRDKILDRTGLKNNGFVLTLGFRMSSGHQSWEDMGKFTEAGVCGQSFSAVANVEADRKPELEAGVTFKGSQTPPSKCSTAFKIVPQPGNEYSNHFRFKRYQAPCSKIPGVRIKTRTG